MPEPSRGNAGDLKKVEDVMKRLSLSRAAIYKLMETGKLGYCKIGRSRRIPEAEIERLITESLIPARK